LSFLAAGLIGETAYASGKTRGSGVLGVLAGFLLVFLLVAVLSFIRVIVPRQVEFSSYHHFPVEQEQIRIAPRGSERLLQHEAKWIFQLPGGQGVELRRHPCGR
jgi:hypothetical protein